MNRLIASSRANRRCNNIKSDILYSYNPRGIKPFPSFRSCWHKILQAQREREGGGLRVAGKDDGGVEERVRGGEE